MDADAIVDKYANAMGKRMIARRKTPLTVEELANVMLYGYPRVMEEAGAHQFFSINGNDAPKRTIATYKEPKESFYVKKYKPACVECGRPCSGSSGVARCWECYRGNAMKKFIDRSASLEYFVDLVSGAAKQFAGGGAALKPWESMVSWFAVTPDFAPWLIEQINEAEELLGVPAAFWREHPYLFEVAEDGTQKPVFRSRTRKTRVRQDRGEARNGTAVRGGGEAFLEAFV